MVYALYAFIVLFATCLGSILGMGGGSIMKPVFDAISIHNATDIYTITVSTTFAMSIFAVGFSFKSVKKENIDMRIFLTLSLGAIGGVFLGKFVFNLLTHNYNDHLVKVAQNAVYLAFLIGVVIYLINSNKVKTLNLKNPLFGLPVGFGLGIFSAFLGIGGGQLNVPVAMFFFGFDIKIAAFASLAIVILGQFSNIMITLANSGVQGFVLEKYPWVLLCAVIFAIAGSFLGRTLVKKIDSKTVKILCLILNIAVIGICISNIIRHSLATR